MRRKLAFASSLTSTITTARSSSPPAHPAYSPAQQKNGHGASLTVESPAWGLDLLVMVLIFTHLPRRHGHGSNLAPYRGP